MSSKQPCNDFKYSGTCRFGTNCRYSHDIRPVAPTPVGAAPSASDALRQACDDMCNYGECSRGDKCRRSHDDKVLRAACLQRWMEHFEMTGEPAPTACKFYMEGGCMKGDKCSFWHPKWQWEETGYYDENGEEYYEEYEDGGSDAPPKGGFDEDEFLRDMNDFENEEEEREMYGGFTYEEIMVQAEMQKEDEKKGPADKAAEDLAALSLQKDKA